MGLHFGILFHGMRGIVTFRLSPMEMGAMKGMSKGFYNAVRRCSESAPFVIPRNDFLLFYICIYVYKMFDNSRIYF